MRFAYRWLLGFLILLVVGITWLGLQSRSGQGRGEGSQSAPGFPDLPPIQAIAVQSESDGLPAVPVITDAAAIGEIVEGLRAASPSHFGDPEPGGWLYRVEFRSSGRVYSFRLNDLRGMGGGVSGKIYPVDGKPEEVWSLPADLVGWLAGDVLPAYREPPTLYMSLNAFETKMEVSANRPLDRSSVEEALKRTIRLSAGLDGREDVKHDIEWTDDRRFQLAITGLMPGESVRLSFESVRSEGGEPLLPAFPSPTLDAVLTQPPDSRRIRWLGDGLRPIQSQQIEASFFQEVRVDGWRAPGLLLYAGDRNVELLSTESGEAIAVRFPPLHTWPGADTFYRGDYGTSLLFSDRIRENEAFVAAGSRAVYRLNPRSGEVRSVYTSPIPIYGLSASPDGQRIALLVGRDEDAAEDCDLIVLDRNGAKLAEFSQAAPHAHEAGSLFPVPLTWNNDEEIVVPRRETVGFSYHIVRIADGSMQARPSPLTDAERRLLARQLGEEAHNVRWYRDPGDRPDVLAVQTDSNTTFVPEVWVVDGQETRWAGAGYLLGWTERGIIVAERPAEGYFPDQVLGLVPPAK